MIPFRSYLIGSDCVCWRIVKGFSKTGSGWIAELLSFCAGIGCVKSKFICIFGIFANGLTPGVFANELNPGVELELTLPNIIFT